MTAQIRKLEDLAEYLQDMDSQGKGYADAVEMQEQERQEKRKKEEARRTAQAWGFLPEDGKRSGNK